MADLSEILRPLGLGGKIIDTTLLLYVIGFCALAILVFVVIKKIRDRKYYDILVEVTPAYGIKDILKKEIVPQISEKGGLFKNKQIDTIVKDGVVPDYTSYYVAGAYLFNKNKGIFYIRLKDKAKTKIQGIPYVDPTTKQPFFKQIKFGKFTRYLHLIRYGTSDYKPIVSEINLEKLREIKNTHDSESTYVALQVQEEIFNRYKKGGKFIQFLPWIIVGAIGVIFVIAIYIQGKFIGDLTDQLGHYTSQLSEMTKALMSVAK